MEHSRLSLSVVAVIGTLGLLGGCSPAERADGFPIVTTQPGSAYGEVPPRLIMRDGFRVWSDPSAFGPVPLTLQKTGDAVCATMNTPDKTFVARGYHPKAIDTDGVEFQGGGYYCVAK